MITIVTSSANDTNQRLGRTILDITLLDSQGNSITQLDLPLTVCLPQLPKKKGEACLSYFDEKQSKWICEDECLSSSAASLLDNLWCGETDHLTNFALLLSGAGGNGVATDPCSSSSPDSTLSWVSLGMVAGAVVLISFCAFLAEIQVRWKRHQLESYLSRVSSLQDQFSRPPIGN